MIRCPTEDIEQITVADWLRAKKILFHHGNRKGQRKVQHIMKEARLGSSKGFPDLLIFDRPPLYPSCSGIAIEMKRVKGGKLDPAQGLWLNSLAERGWIIHVAKGANDAIRFLEGLGYGR